MNDPTDRDREMAREMLDGNTWLWKFCHGPCDACEEEREGIVEDWAKLIARAREEWRREGMRDAIHRLVGDCYFDAADLLRGDKEPTP